MGARVTAVEIAVGQPLRVGQQSPKGYAEQEAGNVGQISHAAAADFGDSAQVPKLDEEPEADKQDGWDVSNSKKDEEEEQCADAVARKRHQKRAHHRCNCAACAEYGNGGVGIAGDLRDHRHQSAAKVEEQEA